MCGIFGYFDRRGVSLAPRTVEKMGQAIFHRGPDDAGIFHGPGVALGNQRLSIIDIAGGHQPFMSEDGQIVVVQNGEIFNYVELARELAAEGYPCTTQCDTEVILRLYQRYGIEFIKKLNGMFAIAIYDARQQACYLIRDRVGVKPLYVYHEGPRIYFASEIKALLATGIPREVNMEALEQYLTFNYVPPPLTMFNHIRHIMPGVFHRYSAVEEKSVAWWQLSEIQPQEQTESAWMEQFNETLSDAVRIRMRADVSFGAFLSGGVDSSTVVGYMRQHQQKPLKTFSIGFDDPKYDESVYFKEAAQRFSTQHQSSNFVPAQLALWPQAIYYCDQPHGDVSFVPTYVLSKLASTEVKMVLTGDGADELFAGYSKYLALLENNGFLLGAEQSIFWREYTNKIALFSDQEKESLYATSANRVYVNAADFFSQIVAAVPHMDRINQALYFDTMMLLPGNNLVKPDRMGMAASIEARTPFLDMRMVKLGFSMPGNLKLRTGETKYLYKKAVENLIGAQLTYRAKQMFTVPIGDWLKNSLSFFIESFLLTKLPHRGIFKQSFLNKIATEHVAGIKNYTRELRALIALELWFLLFIDNISCEELQSSLEQHI